jgi:hypothetical protein
MTDLIQGIEDSPWWVKAVVVIGFGSFVGISAAAIMMGILN